MSKREDVSKELKKIYKDAWKDGIWIREFGGGKGFLAAAGSVRDLEELEKKTGKKIDISKLTLSDCVNLSAPGSGLTREEACRDAIQEFKKFFRKTSKGWVRKNG